MMMMTTMIIIIVIIIFMEHLCVTSFTLHLCIHVHVLYAFSGFEYGRYNIVELFHTDSHIEGACCSNLHRSGEAFVWRRLSTEDWLV